MKASAAALLAALCLSPAAAWSMQREPVSPRPAAPSAPVVMASIGEPTAKPAPASVAAPAERKVRVILPSPYASR